MWYAICLGIGVGIGIALDHIYGRNVKEELKRQYADAKEIIDILAHEKKGD